MSKVNPIILSDIETISEDETISENESPSLLNEDDQVYLLSFPSIILNKVYFYRLNMVRVLTERYYTDINISIIYT